MPDKANALRDFLRVCKPGGYVGMNESTWLAAPVPVVLLGRLVEEGATRSLLASQGMTEGMLEQQMRQTLQFEPLQDPFSKAGFVSRALAEQFMKPTGQQREVAVASIDIEPYLAQVKPDEAAVKAYTAALARHDSPDAVQFALERAERRLQRSSPVNPHNMAAVWDRGYAQRRTSTH